MKNILFTKSSFYSLVLIVAMFVVYQYRKGTAPSENVQAAGLTMGSVPYLVKYADTQKREFKPALDSLLVDFNLSLSTYIKESEISVYNREGAFPFKSPYFYPVLARAKQIYETTGGAFDPTVMPLVRAWKFGPDKESAPEKVNVDSLLRFVQFNRISFDQKQLSRDTAGIELDFSAIAKGYAVDVLAIFLEGKGITDYMVEIGGEVRCRGKNARGEVWTIGIDNPRLSEADTEKAKGIVRIADRSVATSGNYRNFYEKDGKRFAHTIDPKTGYPVQHSLLSASVFAPDCMSADAYATAFMVLGLEKSKELLAKLPKEEKIDVYFIYDENGEMKTFASDGIAGQFVEAN